jgi:hypothetical protein
MRPGQRPAAGGNRAQGRPVVNAQRTPIEGVGQALVMQDITHLGARPDQVGIRHHRFARLDLLTAILGYVELD